MATFNAFQFLNQKAKTSTTTVRTDDGISAKLKGLPKSYTATNLAKLAESQEKDVPVSLPKADIGNGTTAKSRVTLKPKDAGTFVRNVCGNAAEESAPSADAA